LFGREKDAQAIPPDSNGANQGTDILESEIRGDWGTGFLVFRAIRRSVPQTTGQTLYAEPKGGSHTNGQANVSNSLSLGLLEPLYSICLSLCEKAQFACPFVKRLATEGAAVISRRPP
jgi:hypothetical protein